MKNHEKVNHPPPVDPNQKKRIETQIHRRRTVKACSPLELEWETALPQLFPRKVANESSEGEG